MGLCINRMPYFRLKVHCFVVAAQRANADKRPIQRAWRKIDNPDMCDTLLEHVIRAAQVGLINRRPLPHHRIDFSKCFENSNFTLPLSGQSTHRAKKLMNSATITGKRFHSTKAKHKRHSSHIIV